MEIKAFLADFKKEIDREIEAYFNNVIKETSKHDFLMAEALENVKKMILAGGKRLRPALMYYGYLGTGGKEKKKMLKTAVSVELIHFFLLIHDDIIDRDLKRHGKDTVHFTYEKIAKKTFPKNDSAHFGNSMAIIVGDMISALGNQIIYQSGFDPALVVKALHKLQSVVSFTVIGQAKDIYMQNKGQATEGEVLEMYTYKTAKYTFEGPLHLGAILGGSNDEVLADLSKASIPLGIAFQIKDDLLGLFGSEKKVGKPVGSDIKEGKQTILVAKARENADRKQKKILESILGKKDLASEELKTFKKIIQDTGALAYANDLIDKEIEASRGIIKNIKISRESRDFLLGIADYVKEREI